MSSESLGLKVVSVRTDNKARGLPTVPATVIMFEASTGLPSAVIAATWLTALRTAAGSGAATRAMAPANPKTLVVFGAGLQAEAHIAAMLHVRPSICKIVIVNRSRQRAECLAATLQRGMATEVVLLDDVAGVERVVREADILCTTTNTSTPLWNGEWLKTGAHINAIGSYTPQMQEVDVATVARCHIVVDSAHAMVSSGDLCIPLADGIISAETQGLVTLGSVLADAGEEAPWKVKSNATNDCTLFKSVGVSVQDVATGAVAVTRAKELGLGSKILL
jgi:ornithine cyclodeaminase